MKYVYCANCGMKLGITRKAIPKMAKIIDVVEYHECTDEPAEINFEQADIPSVSDPNKGKFVQNLNDLIKDKIGKVNEEGLRDRRPPDQVLNSLAPDSVIKNLQTLPVSEGVVLDEE